MQTVRVQGCVYCTHSSTETRFTTKKYVLRQKLVFHTTPLTHQIAPPSTTWRQHSRRCMFQGCVYSQLNGDDVYDKHITAEISIPYYSPPPSNRSSPAHWAHAYIVIYYIRYDISTHHFPVLTARTVSITADPFVASADQMPSLRREVARDDDRIYSPYHPCVVRSD